MPRWDSALAAARPPMPLPTIATRSRSTLMDGYAHWALSRRRAGLRCYRFSRLLGGRFDTPVLRWIRSASWPLAGRDLEGDRYADAAIDDVRLHQTVEHAPNA